MAREILKPRDIDELTRSINERLREIYREIDKAAKLDADGNLDLGGGRIRNLGAPKVSTDAVQLGAVDRAGGGGGTGSTIDKTTTINTVVDAGPAPSRITSLVIASVDYGDPMAPKISGSATLPATMNGFSGCEGYMKASPTERYPIPFLPYIAPDGTFTFKFDWWRPTTETTFTLYLNERNAEGITNAWDEATMAHANVTITAAPSTGGGYTPPGDADPADWDVTAPSGVDLGVFGGQWLMKLDNFTFSSIPAAADIVKCYYYPGATPPADPSGWYLCALREKAASGTMATEQFPWPNGGSACMTIRYRTYGDEAFPTAYNATTPGYKVITIPPHSAPPNNCVTWSAGSVGPPPIPVGNITVKEYYRSGIKYGAYRFAPTINWNEPLLAFVSVERRFRSAGFVDPSSPWQEVWFAKKGDPAEWGQDEASAWPWTDDITYQQFRYVAVGHDTTMRVVQAGPTINQEVDESGGIIFTLGPESVGGGLEVGSDGKVRINVGPGVTIRNGELTNLTRDLFNRDYEDGADAWTLNVGASVESGVGLAGSKGMRLHARGAFVQGAQAVTAREGERRSIKVFAKNNTGNLLTGVTARISFVGIPPPPAPQTIQILAFSDVNIVTTAYAPYYVLSPIAPKGTQWLEVVGFVWNSVTTGDAYFDQWGELVTEPEYGSGLGYDASGKPTIDEVTYDMMAADTSLPRLWTGAALPTTEISKLITWAPGGVTGAGPKTLYRWAEANPPEFLVAGYRKLIAGPDIQDELTVHKLKAEQIEADAITAGHIAAGAIITEHMAGNEILVGGSNSDNINKPPRFKVIEANGTWVAFIGAQDSTPTPFVGGWFSRLKVSTSINSTDGFFCDPVTGLKMNNVPFRITGGAQIIELDTTSGLKITATNPGAQQVSQFEGAAFKQKPSAGAQYFTVITPGDISLGPPAIITFLSPMRLLSNGTQNYINILNANGTAGGRTVVGVEGIHKVQTTGEFINNGFTIAKDGRLCFRPADFINSVFTLSTFDGYMIVRDTDGTMKGVPYFNVG